MSILEKLFGRTQTETVIEESAPAAPMDVRAQRYDEVKRELARLNAALETVQDGQRAFQRAHFTKFQHQTVLCGQGGLESLRREWASLIRAEVKIGEQRDAVLAELARLKKELGKK